MVYATLQNTAAVTVGSNNNTIGANSIEDELREMSYHV